MENIIQQVSILLSKLSFLPSSALQLAFVGIVLLVIVFIISVLITLGSKIRSLTKKILEVSTFVAKMERVDEENVDVLNKEISKLPETIVDGWGRFMEQRVGYPSDYMKEDSVLDENTYSTKNTVGKVFFKVFGFLMVALVATIAVYLNAADASSIGLKDFFENFIVVGSLIGSVFMPILFFIIFDVIVFEIYRKQRNRLQLVYKTYQDTLDQKVVIYSSVEKEFTSENLDEITKNIEDIIAQKIDSKEIIDVITAPKFEDLETNEEIAPVKEAAPVKEIVKIEEHKEAIETKETQEEEEEFVATESLTKEEQKNYLGVLINVVESAIADPEVKIEELEQIAELIYSNLGNFEEVEDRSILDECLRKLSDVFYGKKQQ